MKPDTKLSIVMLSMAVDFVLTFYYLVRWGIEDNPIIVYIFNLSPYYYSVYFMGILFVTYFVFNRTIKTHNKIVTLWFFIVFPIYTVANIVHIVGLFLI